MLQTIDLCATDEWFVCYKPIVYVIQTYGLGSIDFPWV